MPPQAFSAGGQHVRASLNRKNGAFFGKGVLGMRMKLTSHTEKFRTNVRRFLLATSALLAFVLLSSSTPPLEAASTGPGHPQAKPIAYENIAATLGEVPLSRVEQKLFDDAADGYLGNHDLLTASLIAGGIDDPYELDLHQIQFDGWVEELERQAIRKLPETRRAEAIFHFMHTRLFHGGYALECTNVFHIFQTGRYNCVSGTILYCCLANRFGLDVRGREITGHAMCRLFLENRAIDIEVTCPRWFELLDNPKRQAKVIEKTLGYCPGDSSENFRDVTPVELVATIYYNRGVDLLLNQSFAEALASNQKTLRLDPESKTAWGNLLATLNNWAIHEADQCHYAKAVELLQAGMALQPQFETFQSNYAHVTRRWAEAQTTESNGDGPN